MPQTFQCPACGAPLDYPNTGETTIRCPFCSNSVIVPESIRSNKNFDTAQVFEDVNRTAHLPELAEIGRLIRAGNKIEAIKVYRQAFGVGLKEAKDAVEAMERGEPVQISRTVTSYSTQMPQSSYMNYQPVTPTVNTGGSRVFGVVIAVLILFMLIGFGLFFLLSPTSPESSDGSQTTQLELPSALATAKAQVEGITLTLPSYGDASLILSFGEKGMGPGQFDDARNISVDPQGNMYLGEYQGGRILMFDTSGKFVTQWNTGEKKAALFGLAADRSGTLYLAESGDLFKYKAQSGELISRTKYGGVGSFVDFATLTPNGETLLVSSGEDVWLFNAQGKQTLSIPKAVSSISDDSELETKAAIDGQGNIYLLGTFNDAVFKYSAQGKYLTRFGGDGDKPGLFQAPEQIAVDGLGRVYVSDMKGVQIFDTNGRYLGLIKVDGAAFGLAVDDQNNLYVVTNSPKVYKFKVTVTP